MDDPDISRRKLISSVVSNICLNVGFQKSEAYALETLCSYFLVTSRMLAE